MKNEKKHFLLLKKLKNTSSAQLLIQNPQNLTHSFFLRGSLWPPQFHYLNSMFNLCFIFQSVVLMFPYVGQDVNFGTAIMFRS